MFNDLSWLIVELELTSTEEFLMAKDFGNQVLSEESVMIDGIKSERVSGSFLKGKLQESSEFAEAVKGRRKKTKEEKIAYAREYYQKNKDRIAQRRKVYRDKNKESIALYAKKYREKNKEEIARRAKIYREKNKMTIAEYARNWYQKNKGTVAEKTKLYRENNKEKIALKKKEYRERTKARTLIQKEIINTTSLPDQVSIPQHGVS
ncbi:MAG: hypothetical protein CMP11_09325 [Zetaproteobacteria bacterium]|nr:hypothetical protein [Pseudobdellovibrionaceae bacterium]|tara:strand:+ start:86 stop:703 length:618 start_codon:yes stop_codon:yes gene_type:complete